MKYCANSQAAKRPLARNRGAFYALTMRYFARILLTTVFLPLILSGVACGGDNGASATSVPPKAAATTAASAAVTAPTSPATIPNASGGIFDMTKATTTASGLKYTDAVVGTGDQPRPDQSVVVNYTGRLASDGKVFDSTNGRGTATFPLARVIPGFSEGLRTMRPGGKRTLYIPAALGYGANPPPGSGIPANADLIFEVELISVK
jgi:peptidylprolyl isomerase